MFQPNEASDHLHFITVLKPNTTYILMGKIYFVHFLWVKPEKASLKIILQPKSQMLIAGYLNWKTQG